MKKSNLLYLVLAALVLSCTQETDFKNSIEDHSKDFSSSLKLRSTYNDYLNEAYQFKELFNDLYDRAVEDSLTNEVIIRDFFIDGIKDYNQTREIPYLDVDFYELTTQPTNLSLNETNLSVKTLYYFSELVRLNHDGNYLEMIDLLDSYKLDFDTDQDLLALVGLFTTIEVYKNELMTFGRCQGSGSALASAAVSGAITGAVWGFKLGSWLGPAGTVAGTVGGAIAGSIISSIVNMGVQAVVNCR